MKYRLVVAPGPRQPRQTGHTNQLAAGPCPSHRNAAPPGIRDNHNTGLCDTQDTALLGYSPRNSTGHFMEQRFTFDQIANVYRAARPGYPEALVDDVLSRADLKPNDAIF
jgi:hypothetical protein